MNQNSKIIILRGNSGSGKTTAAKALQRKFGRATLLISQDQIRREMLWVKDGPDTKALPFLMELIRYGRENCEVVILEGILYADWYRELFEQIKIEYDRRIYAYYYDIPFEETLDRHKTKPNCCDFGAEEMKQWWKEKDYIGIIPEKIVAKDFGLEDTVDLIYHDVMQK